MIYIHCTYTNIHMNFTYKSGNSPLKMISSNCDLLGHRPEWNSPLVLWRPLWLLLKVLEGVELLVAQNLGFLLWHLLNQSNYFPWRKLKKKRKIYNFFPFFYKLKMLWLVTSKIFVQYYPQVKVWKSQKQFCLGFNSPKIPTIFFLNFCPSF